MGLPSGTLPASAIVQKEASTEAIPSTHDSTGSYAKTLTETPGPSAAPKRIEPESIKGRRTSHNGKPAVIFKATDFYGVMASHCRRTIVGRFLKSRPQIDSIRSKFSEKFPMKGTPKIGVFDNFNIFLNFTNEEDYNFILYKRLIEVDGYQIWLQKWTPDFKPEEDLPIVPVWILLPGLPFHLHNWHYVKQIANEVGTPLEIDVATRSMTRPSMAKVRVELDLLKPLVKSVWIGIEDDNVPLKGFEQKIEFENIPKYCKHCRKLGHNLIECRVLEKKKQEELKEEEEKIAAHKNEASRKEQNVKKFEQNKKKNPLEQNGKFNENQQNERGREEQINNGKFLRRFRGKSEPPKTVFKPTGAIFGVNKPMPENETQRKENVNNVNQGKDKSEKKSKGEQEVSKDNIEEIGDMSVSEKKDTKADGTDHNFKTPEGGKTVQEGSKPSQNTFMINDPNELEIVFYEEGWEHAGSKKKRSSGKRSKKEKQAKTNHVTKEGEQTITQNSFDELLEEGNKDKDEEELQEEINEDKQEPKQDNDDEWAEVTSTEEENTSDESEEENEDESEEDEEEESEEEEELIKDLKSKKEQPGSRKVTVEKMPPGGTKGKMEGEQNKRNISAKNQKKDPKKTSKQNINV
ncbi:uncharacterized protein LOC132047690 [Lycium ferocissimum]|uniref:uncharacterized protein LOC132047690 n=1 Tax=Lycium ferocissimum TaxID=112874 RepID=UPI0028163A43|nr:uncharacterized protein LOC132047690 [Lycium ferocissimum]